MNLQCVYKCREVFQPNSLTIHMRANKCIAASEWTPISRHRDEGDSTDCTLSRCHQVSLLLESTKFNTFNLTGEITSTHWHLKRRFTKHILSLWPLEIITLRLKSFRGLQFTRNSKDNFSLMCFTLDAKRRPFTDMGLHDLRRKESLVTYALERVCLRGVSLLTRTVT